METTGRHEAASAPGKPRPFSMASTRTRRPESSVADIARFVCDFYQEHDYHTFLNEAGADAFAH